MSLSELAREGRGNRAGDAERLRRPLFRKYFLILFVAVTVPLLVSGATEAWFGYRDQRAMLDQRLLVEARAAGQRIRGFLDGIGEQVAWTVQIPWTETGIERHRVDALRLMRQVPAIVELTLVDGDGKERLKVSRFGRDVIDSGADRSADPAVAGARETRLWYGPVALIRGSEPHMTLALAGNRRAVGVSVVLINLKLIWEVITAIRVGDSGRAFVADRDGKLVAHPNISLVLQGADEETSRRLNALAAAAEAAAGSAIVTEDFERRTVLAAMVPVTGVEWRVFAVLPLAEALAPVRAALWRTGSFVLAGAVFAALLALFLARRMTVPIRELEQGVARIGAGHFDHRIAVATGDELERLAGRVNQMAVELALSQERSERIDRLKRFLSPQIAELVEQAGQVDLLAARRTEVVVVFCDLRGFTPLSLKAEPEEIMRVLAEYYEALGRVIQRFDATLTNFSGDGLMLVLNAPLPCPDDPASRAMRMAAEMQNVVQGLIRDWRTRGYALGFGIGLAKGEATVGRIGYEGRYDYTAVGNVTNLAARLCAVAADRQVLLDSETAAALSAEFALTTLGERDLKGFDESIVIYAMESNAVA